jgi:thiamine-monophosphate kinase
VSSTAPLDEFGRIARFFAPLAGPGGLGLLDDAAIVDLPPGRLLVVTADAMVEGVHYLPDDPPDTVARKLLRVNLSDLAAMGAVPRHYLMTLALPPRLGEDWLAGFAAGLAADQAEFGIELLGGDSVATSGPAALSVTALGSVAPGAAIRRSGARSGDILLVSGTIGDAALGLRVRRGELSALATADRDFLEGRYRVPVPRLSLGTGLPGLAHAMIDVSDGLVADLGHLCAASGSGAVLDAGAVPLSPASRRALAADPSLLSTILTGGDDYELLFAASPDAVGAIAALARAVGVIVTPVGQFVAGGGVEVRGPDGRHLPLARTGYRHF